MILKVLAAADTELGKLEKAKSPDDLKKSAMEALGNIMAATGAQ